MSGSSEVQSSGDEFVDSLPGPGTDISSTFLSSDEMDALLENVRSDPQPITLPVQQYPSSSND